MKINLVGCRKKTTLNKNDLTMLPMANNGWRGGRIDRYGML